MSGKGFEQNGVQFNLENPDMYHYEAFKYGNVQSDDLRKEYSRLRQVANKRLSRMKGTEYEKSQTYIRNYGKYTTIAEIEAEALKHAKNLSPEAAQKYVDSHIAKKTADLYRYLTSKTGTIRGMQRAENDLIQAMRERGLTFINKGNIRQFGEYMEYLRAVHGSRMFDSERAVDLFQAAKKKGIEPMEVAEDFAFWTSHVEELEELPKFKNKNMRNADEYRRILLG